MVQLTVTAKGQVTFKKGVLDHMNIAPGEKLDVDFLPDGKVVLQKEVKRTATLEDLFGSVKNEDNIHLTIEEMNDVIGKAWAGER